MNEDVLGALADETSRTADFLASLTLEDWLAPTRCAPMSVHELAAHAWRGSARISEMIAAGPCEDEAEKDAVTYFRYDRDGEAPTIVARAQEAAAGMDASTLASVWRRGWGEAIESAGPLLVNNLVYRTVFGRMQLSEYLKTRVVEVTIHTMDMRDGLGLAPDPTEAGLTVTCDVLRGLLGTDLRPLGIDDERFALTGTGRAPLDDGERQMLGPLAGLFPVLA